MTTTLDADQMVKCFRKRLLGQTEHLLRTQHAHVLQNRYDKATPRTAACKLLFARWRFAAERAARGGGA